MAEVTPTFNMQSRPCAHEICIRPARRRAARMRTALLIGLSLLFLASVAPVAAAGPGPFDGFGRCEIVWVAVGEYEDPVSGETRPIEIPTRECYW